MLELGASRFRTLPLDAIAEADLLTNQDTGLHAKTAHAKLGSADAFVSHSWHDDGAAKYAQLLAWARKFDGRTPALWLDKACIDQSDIDATLACLPLFLSGCKELLVLPGATYPLRLWCVAHYAARSARTHRVACAIVLSALRVLVRVQVRNGIVYFHPDGRRARAYHGARAR